MAYVNVAEWSPEHVADWVRGLDDEVQPYTPFFVNNSLNGCHLLTLCRDDLSNLNISKIGHQELVLEAVEQLKQLHYNLSSETLQSLALKLGCKAQSLYNQLKHSCPDFGEAGKKERVSTETLSAVSDILNLVKSLISWLDRYPFVGQERYTNVRKAVLKLSIELASTAQRDQFAETPHKIIKEVCSNLSSQSDKIVQDFNDSLIIQPAILEVAKIKRKADDDDVGIHINSLYTGIHIIESLKYQSPAYRCGKVEDGDEIVQVNYQTVVGWQVKNIICAMKEHPSEVHLTLKKRPRHPNVLGQVITLWPYRIPSKKTAFKKFYKWNKGKPTKDIVELCTKYPDPRCEMSNMMPEGCCIPANDRERQMLFGRTKSRIRRRATVTGIAPTALQPAIYLDDFIGGNSKKKQSVGRAVSYDPGKVGNVDDSVFKDEPQNLDQPGKTIIISDDSKPNETVKEKKEPSPTKSQFLKPPSEKYLGSCLRRQQPVKEISPSSEISDITLMVNFGKASSEDQNKKTPSSDSPQKSGNADSSKEAVTVEPSRQRLNWLQKQQQAKKDALVNGDTTQSPSESPKSHQQQKTKEISNPLSYVVPNLKRSTNASVKEGRPSLSEIRALKRAAEAKTCTEKTDVHTRKNPPLPRQHVLNKRNTLQNQHLLRNMYGTGGSGVKYDKTKENELIYRVTQNSNQLGKNFNPQNLQRNSKFMNYSVLPQYPYQMHESKIVSLKPKSNTNSLNGPRTKISYVDNPTLNGGTVPNRPLKSCLPQQTTHRPQNKSGLKNPQNNGKAIHPSAFNPLFGRSLSYNDIAFSSGSDSSSYEDEDDDEVYEEDFCDDATDRQSRRDSQNRYSQHNSSNGYPQINPAFAAKVAEVYNMLGRGHCFSSHPQNNFRREQLDPASSAFIDELAKRMYQAFQQDHLKAQRRNCEMTPSRRSKSLSRDYSPHTRDVNGMSCGQSNGNMNSYQKQRNYFNAPRRSSSVSEKPVDLPPPTPTSNKPGAHPFKSATSQEIHNLYTSYLGGKTHGGSHHPQSPSAIYSQSDCSEKVPIYESLSFFQEARPQYGIYSSADGHGARRNQSVMFCQAERESESMQCNDQIISTPSDGWKYFDKALFRPIQEDCCVDGQSCSEHTELQNEVSGDSSFISTECTMNSAAEVSFSSTKGDTDSSMPDDCDENSNNYLPEVHRKQYRSASMSIASIMNNIPKPPEQDCCPGVMKCSSAQTETVSKNDDCSAVYSSIDDDGDVEDDPSPNLGNDDSFTGSLNEVQNAETENTNFSRSSSCSLSSSASGSTISSANSCYYYVETRARPQVTLKHPSSSTGSSTSGIVCDDLSSPILPMMGISMLSKKRSPNSGGSDSGCNSDPHQLSSEDIPSLSPDVMDSGSKLKSSGIITDNIQYSVWKC